MTFSRLVEVGRVVNITFGPDAGKLAVIVEIIDHGRVLVDGPTTGVTRQSLPFKRLALTSIVLKIPRGVGSYALKGMVEKQDLLGLWGQTAWAKKIQQRATRAALTDFERHNLRRLRAQKTAVIAKCLAKTKSQ
ncbi:hypothetical protein BATDEDRAFT_85243 [Batrachochytrium dendrobatidis JAM81]|uniref:KOW domain-containing protein n=2 Tax=Batrachochytrium dendrobatidis TaxID=109871 RepID=F4NUR7_BATDJ|nr:uncharacterized protein BATDEDRAFT_85243 [Batrachochytrium dendrobatidis JAM81]EGF84432.1 hypothetical protein BATDEDRAFT_85243 [Batrachochytrium dendrobatidis JAM81]KAJ8327384.1 hypothetical protein O5D80_004773 [Batrachochytrium dendrobatidis]KAK5665228.1 hypothetical protein QVD99_008074 [Batrachochytrium dendrobatidis]OAJ37487.1 ribosomal protein L14 [Batrachochytrium dendrobatidis JEL423]|eukprot:XP_006676437.1 hypothetical protein BATDEDRAFT_85243 [Batrachochytrium dendrobatidis JAM81]